MSRNEKTIDVDFKIFMLKVEVHYKNVKYLWSKRAFFEPRPFVDEFGRRISNNGMVLIFDKAN